MGRRSVRRHERCGRRRWWLTSLRLGILASACDGSEPVPAGARAVADGRAIAAPGAVDPTSKLILTNDRVRLSLGASGGQPAGITAEVLVEGSWLPMTSPEYGDWTFLDSSVKTWPTKAEIVSTGPDEVAIQWTFGDHATGTAANTERCPYPFVKTVWLRAGESGFFVRMRPLVGLPEQCRYAADISEHEVGFGGLWGSGTVTTSEARVLLTPSWPGAELSRPPRIETAELTRDGDPLVRVLVPLPAAPLMVPAFGEGRFGGVFIHHHASLTYGAYLYASARQAAKSARTVCREAWLNAPFKIPRPDPVALDRCGPDPGAQTAASVQPP